MTLPPERTAAAAALAGGGLIAAIAAIGAGSAWLNHDAGWYLHMAGAWIDGAVLYKDVIDTNPPLIVALTTVPVLVARLLHLPPPGTFKVLMFLAALASLAGGAAILRRLVSTGAGYALGTLALAFLVLSLVEADFGQREHIAVVLVLPYVLASAARAAGRAPGDRQEFALGLLAGLGFALKPHFLLPWLMLETWNALAGPRIQRPWRRPGAWGVTSTLLLYGLLAVLLFPHYRGVAADVVRVYGALDAPAAALVRLTDLRVWGLALAAAALLSLPSDRSRAGLAILVTATGFLAAALAQRKGWPYHLYPFRAVAGLYFAMTLVAILESHPAAAAVARGGRRTIVALAAALLLVLAWRSVPRTAEPSGIHQVRALHDLVSRERAESLAVLSMRTILFPAFPVVNYTGSAWVMRHHSLWFLPGLYAQELTGASGPIPHRQASAMDPLERRYFAEVLDDLCARPPRMLVVEPPLPPGRGPGSIDLLAYYGQDPRFARLFSAYEPRGTFGPFTAYVRPGEAGCDVSAGPKGQGGTGL